MARANSLSSYPSSLFAFALFPQMRGSPNKRVFEGSEKQPRQKTSLEIRERKARPKRSRPKRKRGKDKKRSAWPDTGQTDRGDDDARRWMHVPDR